MSTRSTTITITSTVLLKGLERGSEEAWRQLCKRYEPVLLRFARRCGLKQEDARDVVQDTLKAFLESYRAGRYDRRKGRLRSWVQGIALNKIREAHRRLDRPELQVADGTDATPFLDRIPDERDLSDIFDREWEQGVLAECLRRVRQEVDAKTFAAFDLYARKEWPTERVAAHLGIAKSTVYVHKSRILARLSELRKEIAPVW
jgi:RNA polymerase sigma-70 factor (ECF subfamily)